MKFEVNYSVARHLCQKALSYRVEFCLVKLRLTEYFYIGLVQFGPAEKKNHKAHAHCHWAYTQAVLLSRQGVGAS